MEMFESTTCGSFSVTATRNVASARWNAPCELSSAALQWEGSSTRNKRGRGVECVACSTSAAKEAPPSLPRSPCMSLETAATSKFECWCPSCTSGSAMHFRAECRVSRCLKASADSKMMNPASDTYWATCCQAAGSPNHSAGMLPLPIKLRSSPKTAQRDFSKARWISFASSKAASCSASPGAPRRAPLPRPRPAARAASGACFSTLSAAHFRKNTATLAAVRTPCKASLSFCLAEPDFNFSASPTIRREASTRRSTSLGRVASSSLGHACSSAKISEKCCSEAMARPPEERSFPTRPSKALPACCWDHSSTGGRSCAQSLSSPGCASNSSGL
mmetsp:Transcript_93625/g.261951  ORF Transcript_93625/g.261951 Transcript_93625/m.261951 type:complete len:333 (-) Transcript_93625:113-1111(-)